MRTGSLVGENGLGSLWPSCCCSRFRCNNNKRESSRTWCWSRLTAYSSLCSESRADLLSAPHSTGCPWHKDLLRFSCFRTCWFLQAHPALQLLSRSHSPGACRCFCFSRYISHVTLFNAPLYSASVFKLNQMFFWILKSKKYCYFIIKLNIFRVGLNDIYISTSTQKMTSKRLLDVDAVA